VGCQEPKHCDGVTRPRRSEFDPDDLHGSVIARPLLEQMEREKTTTVYPVVIDLNYDYPGGLDRAAEKVGQYVADVIAGAKTQSTTRKKKSTQIAAPRVAQYVFAWLTATSIRRVVRLDRDDPPAAIFRIWPDFEIRPLIDKSAQTIKATAARTSFAATGEDIVWAVLDSGIDGDHPHFKTHATLDVAPLQHRDFTDLSGQTSPTTDVYGHGTHVAGIIAGEMQSGTAVRAERDERGNVTYRTEQADDMAGMAPKCRLVSFKVLNDQGKGMHSAIITALQHIDEVNSHGRNLKIHGVNLSVGYPFDPEWFACGESPLCVEVSRLVRSGVVVVAAAGNTGYGFNQLKNEVVAAGLDLTINDPGNAEMAITVGSTHRDMPHRYGVSYFSSKGPTGDGRAKPDLVAPGERIMSCAAGSIRDQILAKPGVAGPVDYVEYSGTSMAAPHVSGAIAAFLSVRREFVGHPDEVKQIFTKTATDLGRVSSFQGAGLVDVMRAIQSV
jgi:serine protease AprX